MSLYVFSDFCGVHAVMLRRKGCMLAAATAAQYALTYSLSSLLQCWVPLGAVLAHLEHILMVSRLHAVSSRLCVLSDLYCCSVLHADKVKTAAAHIPGVGDIRVNRGQSHEEFLHSTGQYSNRDCAKSRRCIRSTPTVAVAEQLNHVVIMFVGVYAL